MLKILITRYPRSAVFLFSLAFLVFLLAGLDLILGAKFFKQGRRDSYHRDVKFDTDFSIFDKLLGYKPIPNNTVKCVFEGNNRTVLFKASYSIDEYSRRITPVSGRNRRHRYILFFGCSFVFGEGLNDNQTLPFYLAENLNEYMPYNYGFCGYGPQQMLAKLEEGSLPHEIQGSDGMAIYVFIDDHIGRLLGSMRVVTAWGAEMPYYCFEKRGAVARRGSFKTGRPRLFSFYTMLQKSNIIKRTGMDIPLFITEDHIRFTAAVFAKAYSLYKKQFKNENFYIVSYPYESRYFIKLKPYLERAGIKCLDYSYLCDTFKQYGYIIKGDGHPAGLSYKNLALQIASDIKKLLIQPKPGGDNAGR